MKLARPIITVLVVMLVGAARTSASDLTILPGDFTLTGPAARQTLLAQETHDGKLFGQLAAKDVTLTSSDEKVAKIDAGAAVPVANGTATITAKSNDRTAAV
jgi:hypothetical protein